MGLLLGRMETNLHDIHAKKLQRLLTLYDPTLNWSMEANALQHAIKETRGLLPFNHAWLDMQDEYKQFGLYLSACQAYTKSTTKVLADVAQRLPVSVADWKKGLRYPSDNDVITKLSAFFSQSGIPKFDPTYFQALAEKSGKIIQGRRRLHHIAAPIYMSQYIEGMYPSRPPGKETSTSKMF